jgi:hypothetical protein
MPDRGSTAVPPALLRNLADSELEVLTWDGTEDVLLLRIIKDVGPESGVARLSGVTHVNLPPHLEVETIKVGGVNDLPPHYFGTYSPHDHSLDSKERVYFFQGSWGEQFFVIAESLEYSIDLTP